jgi:hypothetical protein
MVYEGYNIPSLTREESLKTRKYWMILFLEIVPRNPLFPIRVLMVFLQKSLEHFIVDSYSFEILVSSAR